MQGVRADLGLDPLGPQLLQDPVAVVELDHVRLPAVHVAFVGARQQYRQVAQPLGVPVRDSRARDEQLFQAPELRQPDRAEDVREPVVEPRRRHVRRNEAAPPVVAHGGHGFRDRGVVRGHGAALAGGHDLARMEAEAAEQAEPAAGAAPPPRTERPGRVLEHRQPVRQLVEPRRPSEEVHCEDSLRPRPDVDPRRVDVHRLGVDVDEDRPQARQRDDVADLVARLEPERQHREVQSRGARRDGERMLDLTGRRELLLERRDLRPHRQHAALEDPRHLGELGVADVRPP